MEKLLHERLREPDTELCIGEMLELIVTGKTEDCKGRLCGQCIVDAMNALADEIERTYHPIPCDPDGNPWRIGDDCITAEGEEATIAGYRNGCRVFIDLHDERCFARCYASDLKRPTPKVYDADGVACKSNDEVWSTSKEGIYEEGDMMIVVGIDAGVKERQVLVRRALGGAGEHWVNSKYLTHERPVFDAEGVRICKGDTVWDTEEGKRYNVFEPDDFVERSSDIVRIGDSEYIEAKLLTHREPDSLERIKADRELTICEYNAKYQDAVRIGMDDHLLNRAIALIERGAL